MGNWMNWGVAEIEIFGIHEYSVDCPFRMLTGDTTNFRITESMSVKLS